MSAAETRSPPHGLAPVGSRRRRALAALAEDQFGVVSREQVLGLGYSSTGVGDLIADGTLHRKAYAVYAVGHPHLTREGWWSLAVRVGGEGTLLSHRASTAVRGLLRAIDRTDIIVAKSRGIGVDLIRAHQSVVAAEDRDVVHGLPVTGFERTMVDLAASEPRRLVEALEQSVILEAYDAEAMRLAIERFRGLRGVARLKEAIARLPDDPARFRSGTERRARDLIVSAGLPEPLVNTRVVTGAGGGYELDLYWPGLGKSAEIDGPRHDLPWQQASDRIRDAVLRKRGIEVQRHKVEVVDHTPDHFVQEIGAFLAETR